MLKCVIVADVQLPSVRVGNTGILVTSCTGLITVFSKQFFSITLRLVRDVFIISKELRSVSKTVV